MPGNNFSKNQDLNDPYQFFDQWFEKVKSADLYPFPNAMTLATADLNGVPSARIVLMKDFDKNGITFYTNYNSRKGNQINKNPVASLVFYWHTLERQVIIFGSVTKIDPKESDTYFQSRPRGSQIGAWASVQSKPVKDRYVIEDAFRLYEEKFKNNIIPRPSYWGGYRLTPKSFEFWQGKENRLHERIFFTIKKNGSWKRQWLYP